MRASHPPMFSLWRLKPKDVRAPPHATDTRLQLASLRLRGGAYR